MPMIVDLQVPEVTPPERVVSPDGRLAALIDDAWAGVVLSYSGSGGTPLPDVGQVRQVRIVRQDPGAPLPVPVRSADPAWAVEGMGTAYDHEAPLGVAVTYTATPVYADGTSGPASSLAVVLPMPAIGPGDVWIKSIDAPGLSAQVTVREWPQLTWAARIDAADIAGSPYAVASQDVYGAASSSIVIDAEGDQIEVLERLLTTPGVRLIQTRPDYRRPDQYVLFGDVQQTVDALPTGSRSYTASVTQVARPATAGQALRIPDWSWDELVGRFDSWDAVAAAYSTWSALSVQGEM